LMLFHYSPSAHARTGREAGGSVPAVLRGGVAAVGHTSGETDTVIGEEGLRGWCDSCRPTGAAALASGVAVADVLWRRGLGSMALAGPLGLVEGAAAGDGGRGRPGGVVGGVLARGDDMGGVVGSVSASSPRGSPSRRWSGPRRRTSRRAEGRGLR